MTRFAPRCTAVLLATAASLSAACSNTSPLEPHAATTVRATPTAAPVYSTAASTKNAPIPASAQPNSGYIVAWGSKPPASTQPNSGYIVAWGSVAPAPSN
ncbi:MAG TPA: hypothetical protein VGD56_18490 [Gemmatirosa sp.]